MCAEGGSGILSELAKAARGGRAAWVLWGVPTPGLSGWVANTTLGGPSPLPRHFPGLCGGLWDLLEVFVPGI